MVFDSKHPKEEAKEAVAEEPKSATEASTTDVTTEVVAEKPKRAPRAKAKEAAEPVVAETPAEPVVEAPVEEATAETEG